ncbi:MAG: cytochrome c-type biogenesis protein CcmH [Thiobacillus sp.]|nr:cytochrome c-type biogenesis protein CcmH [Thiobacillus sp.]
MRLDFSCSRHVGIRKLSAGCFLVLLCLCSLVFSGAVYAVEVEESRVDIQTRELSLTLRCTVCQSENVWESNSTLAQQVRALIRARLEQGETPQQVKAYLHSRYGDYILMEPRKRGLNWLLWGAPFLLLLVSAAWLRGILLRWRARAPVPPQAAPLSAAQRDCIEQALRKLEHD